jgi:hypothetical protein
MSRPKPIVLLTISNKETYKQEEVLAAEGIWAVFYDGKPINLKSIEPGIQLPRTQVQEGIILQSRTRREPCKETERTA